MNSLAKILSVEFFFLKKINRPVRLQEWGGYNLWYSGTDALGGTPPGLSCVNLSFPFSLSGLLDVN